jgi:hypothetical protein
MKPYAWIVYGTSRLFFEELEAMDEARHCGGTAKAMPIYDQTEVNRVYAFDEEIIQRQADTINSLRKKLSRQREALRKFNKMVQCFNAGFSYGGLIAHKNQQWAKDQKGKT